MAFLLKDLIRSLSHVVAAVKFCFSATLVAGIRSQNSSQTANESLFSVVKSWYKFLDSFLSAVIVC